MKPWFAKEAEVIKFPEPEKKVVQMPNVASYPDFITGVSDLKARRAKGEISQDSHDKLYTDLIHRFMRKEDVESPWFLREAPGDNLKLQVEKAIAGLDLSNEDNVELLRKMYNVLKGSGIDNRMNTIFSKDNDNQGAVLQAVGRAFLDLANQSPDEANTFLDRFEQNPNIIDTKALLANPGTIKKTADLFVGDEFTKKFGLSLVNIKGEGYKQAGFAGPGEIALAVLSSQISLGTGETGGDVVIDSKGYEVKGNKGRLFDKGEAGNGYQNTKQYLAKSNMPNPGNLSIEDMAKIDPELQDVDVDQDSKKDAPRVSTSPKTGKVISDQGLWMEKDVNWWKGFMKALTTDWYGSTWSKYSNELVDRMGSDNFKLLWLKLQFVRYKEIAQHNGIILMSANNYVFATKGDHFINNILGFGYGYAQNISQAREVSAQLKI